MHGRWCMMQVPVTSSATGRIASGEEVRSMGNLSRDEISTLKVVRKTGRIASLPIPIFLKLIGLGLLVVSSGRTWRLTANGNKALDAED